MTDTYELKAAVLAAQEHGGGLPVCATVAVDAAGRLLNGASVEVVGALLEGLGVDALGLNCGAGPLEIGKFAKELSNYVNVPIILSPNAGMPQLVDGRTTYPTGPEEFAAQMLPFVEDFVAVAGGCCGTTPAHISALVAAVAAAGPAALAAAEAATPAIALPLVGVGPATAEPLPVGADLDRPAGASEGRRLRRITSYAAALDLDAGEPLIDRRIDAAADARLAAALARADWEYATDDALDARDDGAQVIALAAASGAASNGNDSGSANADEANASANASAGSGAGIDEAVALPALVKAVQATVNVPLALVSASLEALAAALRVVNGCPLVELDRLPLQQHAEARVLASRYGAVIGR